MKHFDKSVTEGGRCIEWNNICGIYGSWMVGGKQGVVFKAYLYSDGFGGFLWKKDGNGIFVGMDIHSYCNYSNGNKQKMKNRGIFC